MVFEGIKLLNIWRGNMIKISTGEGVASPGTIHY